MLVRLIVATTALATSLAVPALAQIGTIKRAEGAVRIERGKIARPAVPGSRVDAGDTLVTGKDGRIGVTFIDNARFSVGPNSRVALTRFDFDDATRQGRFDTRVERGQLAIVSGQIAHENPKGMTVQTPTSVLGVRGTRFVVKVR